VLDVNIDALETKGKKVMRVAVPEGQEKPYALDESKIYVRQETDTSLAVRDEIVQLVRVQLLAEQAAQEAKEREEQAKKEVEATSEAAPMPPASAISLLEPPRTGVEIVESVERKGTLYHTLRDLRNGNSVQNVTRSSARRLWRYAITEHETKPFDTEAVKWMGNAGLMNRSKNKGRVRYDLVQRDPDGKVHVYYGVSEDGVHGGWREVVGEEAVDG
jgi:hypothetical protein